MGCRPVVYYSTVPNLKLSDETNPRQGNRAHLDLKDPNYWTAVKPADEDITAIAIDMSKDENGDSFQLGLNDSAVVIVHMRAPSGDEALAAINAQAHAYNNIYMTNTVVRDGVEDPGNFARYDYTKVGLENMSIQVKKEWDDDDNRDNLRPRDITVTLFADGVEKESKTISGPNWTCTFDGLDYLDDVNGRKIVYSVQESSIEGYSSSLSIEGSLYTLTNIHEPEKIDIEGTKTWTKDTLDVRPRGIQIRLYANDVLKQTKYVTEAPDGSWSYSFSNLYKNENGEEIEYKVEEVKSMNLQDYDIRYSDDGYDIENVYHP